MGRKAAADLCLEGKLMHVVFLCWQCFNGEITWLDIIRERFGRSGMGCKQTVGSAFQHPAIYAIAREMQNSPGSQNQLFGPILYRFK